MSAIVAAITDAMAGIPIVNQVWNAIKDGVDAAWKNVAMPVMEFIFKLLGIEDEDIVTVQVISQRIMSDANTPNPAILAALRLQKNDEPILSNLVHQYQQIKTKYAAYDKHADKFMDGRPNASIRTRGINTTAIKTVLDSINGQNNIVQTARLQVPNKNEWVQYSLQASHNYTPYNNSAVINGSNYNLTDVTYNYTTDKYEVVLTSYETVTTTTSDRTVVTVAVLDSTTDRVTTTVYRLVDIIRSVTDDTHTSEQTNQTTEDVATGTKVASDTTVVVSTETTGVVLNTLTLNVVAHTAIQQYIVQYEWVSGEWRYWIHDPATSTYPEIKNTNIKLGELEMLPIVALVQDKHMIDENNKTTARYKQSKEILDKIGVDVDMMLDGIRSNVNGGDVTDCFISFGLSPHDTGEVVSKALYTMCEALYTHAGATNDSVDGERINTFNVTEGRFNQVAKWRSQSRVVVNGVIGTIGTCTHSVGSQTYQEPHVELSEVYHEAGVDHEGNWQNAWTEVVHTTTYTTETESVLIVRKQELDESYVEYRFSGMTSMTYINHNNTNSSLSTLDLGNEETNGNGVAKKMYFSIPLSMFFVQRLTPAEQRELFAKTLRITYYAHNITHLEFYETPTFGNFLKFAAIAIMIFTLGTGSYVSFLIMAAASYVLKRVLESGSAPDWVKAVAAVAYVYAAVTVGGDGLGTGMQMLTGVGACAAVVTVSANAKIQDAKKDTENTNRLLEEHNKKFKGRMDELSAKLDRWSTAVGTKEIAAMQYGVYSPPMPWDIFRDKALGADAYNFNAMYAMPYNTVSNYHYGAKQLGVPLHKFG